MCGSHIGRRIKRLKNDIAKDEKCNSSSLVMSTQWEVHSLVLEIWYFALRKAESEGEFFEGT